VKKGGGGLPQEKCMTCSLKSKTAKKKRVGPEKKRRQKKRFPPRLKEAPEPKGEARESLSTI